MTDADDRVGLTFVTTDEGGLRFTIEDVLEGGPGRYVIRFEGGDERELPVPTFEARLDRGDVTEARERRGR